MLLALCFLVLVAVFPRCTVLSLPKRGARLATDAVVAQGLATCYSAPYILLCSVVTWGLLPLFEQRFAGSVVLFGAQAFLFLELAGLVSACPPWRHAPTAQG